jgi:hypothetical protein
MIKIFLIFFISCSVSATDTWVAAEHPANLVRSISAFTEPTAFLDLKAEFPERLEKIFFQEGKTVQGDTIQVVIATLNNTKAKIELERTQAVLLSERSLLNKRLSEKTIQQRAVEFRKLEMTRLKGLSKEGKIARRSYDQAQFEYDTAVLKVKDIETAIEVQKLVIHERSVAVKNAQEDLSRYTLYAPKGWILNERFIEPGSWVMTGEKIAQLVDVRQLSVFVRLNEEELTSLHQKINLTIKKSGKQLKAKVRRIDMNFDPNSRKRLVELQVEAAEFEKPSGGLELELNLNIPYPKPAVEIPLAYTFRKLERDYIKLTNGREIALSPLRKTTTAIIVHKESLPKDAIIVKMSK